MHILPYAIGTLIAPATFAGVESQRAFPQPPPDGDIPTGLRFAPTGDKALMYQYPVLVPPTVFSDPRMFSVAPPHAWGEVMFGSHTWLKQGGEIVEGDNYMFKVTRTHLSALSQNPTPDHFTSNYGPVGEASEHFTSLTPRFTTVHKFRTPKTFGTMQHGPILASYLGDSDSYREASIAIFRFGMAVYMGEDNHKTYVTKIGDEEITAKTVYETDLPAYKLTPLLKKHEIPYNANYEEGTLTWKVKGHSFKIPFASRYYTLDGKLMQGNQYFVIHEGNFYVGREVMESVLSALKTGESPIPEIKT